MYVVVWVPDSPTVCVCARVFESIVLTCEFVRLCMLCFVVCLCFLTCVCQSITIGEPRGVFKCMCRIELEKLLARSDQGPPVIAIHHVDEYYPNPTDVYDVRIKALSTRKPAGEICHHHHARQNPITCTTSQRFNWEHHARTHARTHVQTLPASVVRKTTMHDGLRYDLRYRHAKERTKAY